MEIGDIAALLQGIGNLAIGTSGVWTLWRTRKWQWRRDTDQEKIIEKLDEIQQTLNTILYLVCSVLILWSVVSLIGTWSTLR